MSTTTHNEAAEPTFDPPAYFTDDEVAAYRRGYDDGERGERRATVERIRERLTIHNEFGCTNVLWPDEVNAILDEEAAR